MKQHVCEQALCCELKSKDSSNTILPIRLEISLKQAGESNLLCRWPVLALVAWNNRAPQRVLGLGQAHSCLFLRDSASYWKMLVTNTIQSKYSVLICMCGFLRPTPCCSSMSSKQGSMLNSLKRRGWIKHLRPRNFTETILNQLNIQLINQFWSCCTR